MHWSNLHYSCIKNFIKHIHAGDVNTANLHIPMLHLVMAVGRMWQQIRLWVTQLSGADFTLLLLLQPAVLGQVNFLHNHVW